MRQMSKNHVRKSRSLGSWQQQVWEFNRAIKAISAIVIQKKMDVILSLSRTSATEGEWNQRRKDDSSFSRQAVKLMNKEMTFLIEFEYIN